jgi:spore germination cell wall hydrolase CwlJ-like protein
MVVSRRRPRGARSYASLGLGVLVMGLMPRTIGYQDLASLMARQPDVSQRARAHMMTSPFGTIHAATFSFPQPVGTQIPEPPLARLASLANIGSDPAITGSIQFDSGMPMQLHRPHLDFPSVNRALKGDLLVSRRRDEPAPRRDLVPGRVKTVSFPRPADMPPVELPQVSVAPPPKAEPKSEPVIEARSEPRSEPKSEPRGEPGALTPSDLALKPDAGPAAKNGARLEPGTESRSETRPATFALASVSSEPRDLPSRIAPLQEAIDDSNAAVRLGRLYFGNNPVGDEVGPIQPWPMDEEWQVDVPRSRDPDLKQPLTIYGPDFNYETPGATSAEVSAGETIAPKGEVTGPLKRPKTPAERLGLDIKQRAKSEKCLADAVYFESRGEAKRGQIAVAQVVMNRVFSGFYPNNVCGVVYQNSHRKLACQFTFACDGIPDVVKEPEMWKQATEIARDMLDGKLWLSEVGHSTHYHAYWVHPAWVREMRRTQKIGVHSFYRPRAWGDGSEVGPLNQSETVPQAPAVDDAAKAKL